MKGTVVHADEAASWDNLHERFEIKRNNHQDAYSLDGACTNMAEEYFSRPQRGKLGIHQNIAGSYLLRYAQESSWRENNRRVSTRFYWVKPAEHASFPLAAGLPIAGHYQANRPQPEISLTIRTGSAKRSRCCSRTSSAFSSSTAYVYEVQTARVTSSPSQPPLRTLGRGQADSDAHPEACIKTGKPVVPLQGITASLFQRNRQRTDQSGCSCDFR